MLYIVYIGDCEMREIEMAIKRLKNYVLLVIHDVFNYQPMCYPIALVHKSALSKVKINKKHGVEIIDLEKTEEATRRIKKLSKSVTEFILEQFCTESIRCPNCDEEMVYNEFNNCYECPKCKFWISH